MGMFNENNSINFDEKYIRGDKEQKEFIDRHIFKSVHKHKIITDKEMKSFSGAVITDVFYVFLLEDKTDKKIKNFIFGKDSFKSLVEKYGLDPKSVVRFYENPLESAKRRFFGIGKKHRTKNEIRSNGENVEELKWHEAAKQLYNLIELIILHWDDKGLYKGNVSPLYMQRDHIITYYYCAPFPKIIRKTINTFSKGNEKTVKEMIDNLSKKNPNFKKEYSDFSKLKEIITEYNKQNPENTILDIF